MVRVSRSAFTLALALAVIAQGGCAVVQQAEKTLNEQTPDQPATPVSQTEGTVRKLDVATIGEHLTVGNVIWTVNIPKRQGALEDRVGTVVTQAVGDFVIIPITIQGASAGGSILSEHLSVVDAAGRRFPPIVDQAVISLYEDEWIIGMSVAAGETVEGIVVFDVANNATGLEIEMKDPSGSGAAGNVYLGL
ncbi:MAG: DUF4352 domain-containing protein [Candidatus Aquicultorales bacterium]